MRSLYATVLREWRLRIRGGGWAASAGLFVLAGTMAPLSLGRDAALLASAAPAILWLAASLSLLIGLDSLYEEDLRTGGLEVYRLSALPLSIVSLSKIITGWTTACAPLCLVAPVILFMFGVERPWFGALGFLLGTPALALIAGTIGSLCAGMRKGTALVVFLSLPLFAPALVFGPAASGSEPLVPLLILAAFSLQALTVCPFITAAALRAHIE